LKNYYITKNCGTNDLNDLFIKMKIITLEQLLYYEKLSIKCSRIKLIMNTIIYIKQEERIIAI